MTMICRTSIARSLRAVALAVAVTSVGASALSAQLTTGTIEGHLRDSLTRRPIANAVVLILHSSYSALTDSNGFYRIAKVPAGTYSLRAAFINYKAREVAGLRVLAGQTVTVDFLLDPSPITLNAIEVTATANPLVGHDIVTTKQGVTGQMVTRLPVERIAQVLALQPGIVTGASTGPIPLGGGYPGGESYDRIFENPFLAASASPLSTFSIDVDHASYSNIRRFIANGQRPNKDAVRIEEMINYFPYDYAPPRADDADPFSVTTELAEAPWNTEHRLLRIGLQARKIETATLPPGNFVFLLDVSGSMEPANRLPLVKSAMRLVVDQLRAQDRVSIVVYAGDAGIRLPPTSGADKITILDAIDHLFASGSTNGSAGLRLAYDVARESRIPGGNSRIILATDGDFNVGLSSDSDMEQLIEKERGDGIYLTVLGVGYGNLKDSKLEKLADKGNRNYAYLDNLLEAHKVLVQEMGGTLMTVAKDVKLQVEFNPATVQAYRLIGYEDRMLQAQDFNNDRKDAGEVGAGHSVTALYEIVPVGAKGSVIPGVDPLRYQAPAAQPVATTHNGELLFVKVRYKEPDGDVSKLLTHTVVADRISSPSADFAFASAVAEFGMLLRDSEYKASATVDDVLARARESLGADPFGYRSGFVQMVEAYQKLPSAVSVIR
jgi:Ca-activated chloride channel family protein